MLQLGHGTMLRSGQCSDQPGQTCCCLPRAQGDPDCNYHHQQPGAVAGETWSSFVSHSADTQPQTFASQGK